MNAPTELVVVGVDGGGSSTRVYVADERAQVLFKATGDGSAVTPGAEADSAELIGALVKNAVIDAEMGHLLPRALVVGVADRESAFRPRGRRVRCERFDQSRQHLGRQRAQALTMLALRSERHTELHRACLAVANKAHQLARPRLRVKLQRGSQPGDSLPGIQALECQPGFCDPAHPPPLQMAHGRRQQFLIQAAQLRFVGTRREGLKQGRQHLLRQFAKVVILGQRPQARHRTVGAFAE